MAMQRTNILRDIDEDAAAGRSYLAEASVARFGPPAPGARAALLRDQIARADALYEEGLAGVPLLRRRPRGDPRGRVDVPGDPAADRARRLRRARGARGRWAGPRKLWIAARRGSRMSRRLAARRAR